MNGPATKRARVARVFRELKAIQFLAQPAAPAVLRAMTFCCKQL